VGKLRWKYLLSPVAIASSAALRYRLP